MNGMEEAVTAAELAGRQARITPLMAAEPSAAKDQLLDILELAKQHQIPTQEALALVNLSACHFRMGDYEKMRQYAELGLVASRIARTPRHETRALNNVGLAHQRLGELDVAVEWFLESLRLAQEILDHPGISRAIGNIALVHSKLGDYQQALTLHEQALEVSQSAGVISYTGNMLASVMEDYFLLGDFQRSLELSGHAISFARTHGLSRNECYARVTYGRILYALGRFPACVRAARAGYRIARWSKDSESASELKWVEGRALMELGDYALAKECFLESLTTQERIGHQEYLKRTHESLAELSRRMGNMHAAAEHRSVHAALHEEYYQPAKADRVAAMTTDLLNTNWVTPELNHPWTSELQQLTQSLKRANTELSHRLAHDPMTGALTRQQFQARVTEQLDSMDPDEIIGVAVVSIDQIRVINDHFGEAVATSVLTELVHRLGEATRYGDFIGRLGGDEFAVCLTHIALSDDLEGILAKFAECLSEPYFIRGDRIVATVSMAGVAAPRDGVTTDELLMHGDLTVQKLKRDGRNLFSVYCPNLSAEERRRRALSYDIRGALQRDEFTLHYQAIIDLENQKIDGVEALIRWQHPEHGLVAPDVLIELAEEGRQILDIGDWVLRQACAQAMELNFVENGLTMAVNVSGVQFAQPDFTTGVAAALSCSGFPPELLIIELTETMMLQDDELTKQHLDALSAMGVRCAVDDFGTGYSNVSVLQDMPVQVLKIDRSFMQKVTDENPKRRRSESLIGTVVALAQNLDLEVIAEGVETEDQSAVLQKFNCDKAQGYLFHRPATVKELTILLDDQLAIETTD